MSFPEIYFLLSLIGIAISLIFSEKILKQSLLVLSFITLLISALSLYCNSLQVHHSLNHVNYIWLDILSSMLELKIDGTTALLCCLTSLSVFTSLLISEQINNQKYFYALIFLLQLGLYGVFMSYDALSFYLFWEMVLIPTYFLCGYFGGSNAQTATLKFFLYTFIGSFFMLFALIYLYIKNPSHSFAWESLKSVSLSLKEQSVLLLAFVLAFAIKMPIFPFHTWQPKLYSNSPLSITVILSSVMVKMGLIGVVRWVIPFFPLALHNYSFYLILLSVIGIIYASLIAIQQKDLKLILAYSSIAHIGLMSAALFSQNQIAINGTLLQMFNHGINIIGLWVLIYVIQKKYNTTQITDLGGILTKTSFFGFAFILLCFANIALPLTNSFTSEFAMLYGLFEYNRIITTIAGISIILSAAYMLRAIDLSMYGKIPDNNIYTATGIRHQLLIKTLLVIIIFLIFYIGIYSKPFYELVKNTNNFF